MVHVRGIDLCSRQLCRSLCLIMLEKYWTIRSKAQNGKIAAMDESVFHEFHQFVLFTEALCTYALRVQEVNEIKLKPTIHKFENSKRSCQCFLPFKQKRCPLKGTSFKFLIKLICIRRSLMCVHIYRLPLPDSYALYISSGRDSFLPLVNSLILINEPQSYIYGNVIQWSQTVKMFSL